MKAYVVMISLGFLIIGYYYGGSYYAFNYAIPKKQCAIVTKNTDKMLGRQRAKSIMYAANQSQNFRFVYYADLYSDLFSFNGIKTGNGICFDYVNTLPLTRGYPKLLKTLSVIHS